MSIYVYQTIINIHSMSRYAQGKHNIMGLTPKSEKYEKHFFSYHQWCMVER